MKYDLKTFAILLITDFLFTLFWINYNVYILLFFSEYFLNIYGVILFLFFNYIILALANKFLLKKQQIYTAKAKYIYIIVMPVFIMGVVLYFFHPQYSLNNLIKYEIQNFRANNLNIKEFTETYTDSELGFSFMYPKQIHVEKWMNANLRVLPVNGSNSESYCDIYINHGYAENVKGIRGKPLNSSGTVWTKKRYDESALFGTIHRVVWSSHVGLNVYDISTEQESESFCEKIVTTFSFY